jgi:hypothetical protein
MQECNQSQLEITLWEFDDSDEFIDQMRKFCRIFFNKNVKAIFRFRFGTNKFLDLLIMAQKTKH